MALDDRTPPKIRPTAREDFRFALRALAEPKYRALFWPQALSLCGTWMQHTAQSWLIYRLSNTPGWLGIITFLTLFPVFVFSLWAGVFGDRHPRKWILWGVNLAAALQSLLLGYLTLKGAITVHQIAIFAFILGIINAFEIPNRQAFILDLLPRAKLSSAVALNSTAFNLARLVGPLGAGILIPWKGEGICFLINAFSYLPVLVALFLLDVDGPGEEHRQVGWWRSLKGGLTFAMSSSELRPIFLLIAVASFSGIWFPSFLPVFATTLQAPSFLSEGPLVLGVLVASVAAGSLAGAYAVAKREDGGNLGRRVSLGALFLTLGLPVFAISATLGFAIPILVGLGFAMVTLNVGTNTLVQTLTPDEFRGRISSVYAVAFLGTGPLGALAAGFAANSMGVPRVLGISGLVGFFLVLLPARHVAATRAIPTSSD